MTRLILASGSESRRQILAAAGVPFDVEVPGVDEGAVKASLASERAGADLVAATLAEMKARKAATSHDSALVLGCDQVLVCGGQLFDKARSAAEAGAVLRELRGRQHELVTAVVLVRDDRVVWHHTARAQLWMRDFSDAFLDAYLVDEIEHILSSVGCYHVEGRGIQLFECIEGDHFTIRGLPLSPLLAALREHGALPS